jgi:hypothetical protein
MHRPVRDVGCLRLEMPTGCHDSHDMAWPRARYTTYSRSNRFTAPLWERRAIRVAAEGPLSAATAHSLLTQ